MATQTDERVLGIDIGGTGIKGALVNSTTGELATERFRLETPQPATPEAIVKTVAQIATHFDWKGSIGVGFPAAIKHGVVQTAANIDKSWIGKDAADLIAKATGSSKVVVANDADVAGYAEMHFGGGVGEQGLVVMCTFGTGIGVALFYKGVLIPNMELGHIEVKGVNGEFYAAESAREREDLSWEKWAKRVDKYLSTLQALLWPDLIIIGGGVSKKHEKFIPLLTVTEKVRVVPAMLLNEAGIVGAAMAAKA